MPNLKPLRHVMLFAMLLTASQLFAASLPPVARDEIEGLVSRLGSSDCKLKRNGSWHTAGEAQAHLRRKLDYLIDRDAVASAEQFIERVASKSSKSGKAYEMQCGKGASVASGQSGCARNYVRCVTGKNPALKLEMRRVVLISSYVNK